MATITLNLGRTTQPPDNLEPHVGSNDTLKIVFHEAGTFYSQDAGDFTPPLPDGVFFQKGQTWPASVEATPNVATRYKFQASSSPSKQLASADVPIATDHVIHVP
jgi:hypothetical protein